MESSGEDAAAGVPPPIARVRGGGAGAGAQAQARRASPKAARGARGARGAAGAALPPLLHMGLYPQREAPGAARARAAAPAARAAPPPRAAPAPKRPRSAGAESRSAAGSAAGSGGESDEEKDSGEQKDSEADSLESEGWAGDEEGEGGEAPRPPRGYQRRRAVRPITDRHQLEPQRLCTYGCGATVWPEEGGICCGMGKHILGPEFNPPIDAEYRVLLDMDHISRDSRLLNSHLAMATQSVTPSRKDGGLTWHEQGGYSHLALFGKTYCVMHGMGGNNALDTFLLPEDLLLDGAQADMGPDYAQRLLRVRKYIADKHPLARHLCSIGELPGEQIDRPMPPPPTPNAGSRHPRA